MYTCPDPHAYNLLFISFLFRVDSNMFKCLAILILFSDGVFSTSMLCSPSSKDQSSFTSNALRKFSLKYNGTNNNKALQNMEDKAWIKYIMNST